MATFDNRESLASVRTKINAAISFVDSFARDPASLDPFPTVLSLTADTTLTYTAGQAKSVSVGDVIQYGGHRGEVAASTASDHHVTTAGGVKLYVLPGAEGYQADAFGLAGDGTTDDTIKMQTALTAASGNVLNFSPGKTYMMLAVTTPAAGVTIRLNGATIKKRPITASDSSNLRAFMGGNTAFVTSGRYLPIFGARGNIALYGPGLIDGNCRSESSTYLPPGGSNTAYILGASFGGNADRAGILYDGQFDTIEDVTISNVSFDDMFGSIVTGRDATGHVLLENIVETRGKSVAFDLNGRTVSPATALVPTGSLTIEGCRFDGTRQYNRGPNGFIITAFAEVNYRGNTIEGRNKITSVYTGDANLGAPDAAKFQQILSLSVCDSFFFAEGIKMQSAAGFEGVKMHVSNCSFDTPDDITFSTGITGGTTPYEITIIDACTFINCGCAVEPPLVSMTVSGNNFLARVAKDTSDAFFPFFSISNNVVATPGETQVVENDFDGGSFDAHGAVFVNGIVGKVVFARNKVRNVEGLWLRSTAIINAPNDQIHILDNDLSNVKCYGRHRYENLGSFQFSDNRIRNSNASAVSANLIALSGTGERSLFLVNSGTNSTWGEVVIADNIISDANNLFAVREDDDGTGFTYTRLIISGNIWTSTAPGGDAFSFLSTATIADLVISNNVIRDNLTASSGWTVTRKTVLSNYFIGSGRSLVNLTGNVFPTGATSTTVGAAGAASALPANPTGYLTVSIDGTARKIPYYAT